MSGFLQVAIGVCFIILCSGFVKLCIFRTARDGARGKKAKQEEDRIVKRLERVEQRLTEVQDVMIALSEKIDYIDGAGSKSWERQEPQGQG